MKKGLRTAVNGLLCLCLMLAGLVITGYAADGDSVEVGGIRYTLTSADTATVTGYASIPADGALTIPADIEVEGNVYKVTTIGDSAFYNCGDLTAVTLPDSLTSIGQWSFRETGLTSIEIPELVTTIGNAAFMSCKDLTTVNLPDNVNSIGSSAFSSCTSLTNVNLPKMITTLKGNVFQECDALTSLIVPNNVTYIEQYAITGCDKLTNITLPENVKLKEYAIFECNALTSITIPKGYSLDPETPIGFCDGLETVIFAEGNTSVPAYFVTHCPNIKRVVLPKSVTKFSAKFSSYPELPDARIHYLGTAEEWNQVVIDDTWLSGLINTADIHYFTSVNEPSNCKVQGYENRLICSADGCGYIYDYGTPLPLSEEHAEMDTATGKCTLCEKDIAVAKVENSDGTTYFAAQTLSGDLVRTSGTVTMLKNATLKHLWIEGGTFDLNGCSTTGYLDVRDTVTILDSKGGGQMSSATEIPVLVNGSAIVHSGNFSGDNADFLVAANTDSVLDLSHYADPADLSVYIVESENLLYESIRLPAGYVLKDEYDNVLPRDAVNSEESAIVVTIAHCEGHDYELRIDENSIRGICKHCLKENGVVSLNAEDCVYDGQPHGAAAQDELPNGWTASLTYYDSNSQELNETPTNAGTYKAKLTCTAYEMTQSIDLTYTISPANIADHLRIYGEPANYDGQPKQAKPVKMDSIDETQLVKNTDYTLIYEPVDAEDALVGGLPVNAGEYKVTVTGKGNYAGTLTKLYIGTDESDTPTYGDVMEIYPAWLFVEEDSVTAKDKVYDGTTAAEISMGTYSGVQGTDIVSVKVTGDFEDADAGENKTVSVTYTTYGEHGSNYEVIAPIKVKANISKRPMTVKIKDQNLSYGEELSADAYDVTGLVEGQKAEVQLIPSTKVITENGTITAQVTVTADGKDVTGSYQITTVPGKLVIVLDTAEVDSSKVETVNNTQQEEIEKVLENVEELLKSDELTEEEKAELTKTKEKAEALLDRIEESLQVLTADEVENTLDTTSENVKLSEKDDIQKAIATMEDALKTYGGNYTDADKKDVQAQIDQLKEALQVIENVESATALIAELPETVEPDDEAAVAKILEAKAAYDALNAYEKSLVDAVKLNTLLKATTDYQIVKGNGTKWKEGDLSFTANGAFKKFVSVFVDGKEVDTANYKAKAGSTIITFKESYVKTLSAGEHTIAVTFTDGAASGGFQILEKEPEPTEPATKPTETKPVNPAVPDTGDEQNLLLWCSWMFLAAGAIWVFGRRFAAK